VRLKTPKRETCKCSCLILLSLSTVLLTGSPTAAQTNAQFVRDLFFVPPLDPQEQEAANVGRILESANESAEEIAKFIGFGISSVPLGSSSAGFSYARDRATGELALKSRSSGPLFAERPLTNGRRVFNFGFNYQQSKTEYNQDIDTADGRADGVPVFDNLITFRSDGFRQFITRRVFLESSAKTFNIFTSFGLTDRIDLGVAVPIVSVSLTGWADESFDISRTFSAQTPQGAAARADRGVPVGVVTVSPLRSQSAQGIGDVVFRSKFALTNQQRGQGAAVGVDITFPTGDEENFLGRGHTTARLLLLASKALGDRASIYGNGGYRFGEESDEAQYVGGIETALLPRDRLTVAMSFLGRSLRDASSLGREQTVSRVSNNLGTTVPQPADVTLDRFFWSRDTVNLQRLSAEFKLHVGHQWLATGAVIFPLNQEGLQPNPIPFVGLEWAGGK
jgi:hypothetical protein